MGNGSEGDGGPVGRDCGTVGGGSRVGSKASAADSGPICVKIFLLCVNFFFLGFFLRNFSEFYYY
jgi:hypothetical protein